MKNLIYKKLFSFLFLLLIGILVSKIAVSKALNASENFRFSLNAVQSVYQNGVPHTDKMGRSLINFDAERSFFPICIYHALTGEHHGRRYSLASLKNARFNCVHTWEGQKLDSIIEDLRTNDLQLIYHGTQYFGPTDEELKKYANDPNILAWYLDEEPTGSYWGSNMNAKFAAFQKRMQEIKEVDQIHPVFILDVAWITPPATAWWIKWNTAGDVSSHDNYPLMLPETTSLSGPRGIPESVSLAVASNKEYKPVWFVPQAFETPGRWYLPDAREERAMVYSAIVHGSTGIIYFALDSWVTRNGSVIGIAPDTLIEYQGGGDSWLVASEELLNQSTNLWNEVVSLNDELQQLKPIILSPTSHQEYKVYIEGEGYSEDPIRSMLKEVDGQFTLITVNLDKRPLRVKYQFPQNIIDIQTLFEKERKVEEMRDKFWVDTYEEFGVHIYKFKLK
ncbi:hypothetical protein [Laspinema olomoucense]|uniref:Glycosyl hydrolase-like 10 domain-containing protein n=1 Tax=Laspinema olomoucense D3b TaxID=2953688 RepID=A0ABT2N6P7_9CYAN|nr:MULTISPECIES: hypothetical protein [unclassified Laspinema]MCT7977400.1 hypothetical protein [Laspinema sp. D3b]MCT7986819.1 hypothetical protein [Laspinema sp. D3a]